MADDGIPWPLRWIVDEHNRDTGFAMLRRSIQASQRAAYEEMAAGHRMIGFTHFGPFPLYHEAYDGKAKAASPESGWDRPEVMGCEAWAHCFRDPDRYLPPDKPRMLISGSDFIDEQHAWKLAYDDGRPGKRWDLVYSCPPTWLNELQKNLDLAKACAVRLAEAGLRLAMVGRAGVPGMASHPNIDCLPQLPWADMLRVTASSRAAFLPNWWDASPRVLTEALALDVPVLVNKRILGGWKYVTAQTGVFFQDDADVVDAFHVLLDTPVHPRDWLLAQGYGRDPTARRFAAELRTLGGNDVTYAVPVSDPPRPA